MKAKFGKMDTSIPLSVEQIIAPFDSVNGEFSKISSFLKYNYGDGAIKIYTAAMYNYLNKNVPARQMVVIHCFNELINLINRQPFEKFKGQIYEIIKGFDYWKMLCKSDDNIDGLSKDLLTKFEDIYKEKTEEKSKVSYTIKRHCPLLKIEERGEIADRIHKTKKDLPKFRHAGDGLHEDDGVFEDIVGKFREFLLILSEDIKYKNKAEYFEELATSNKERLTPEDLENINTFLDGNLIGLFFNKLSNARWFEQLRDSGLLNPVTSSDDNNNSIIYWHAVPYLKSIVKSKSKEILEFVKPILMNYSSDVWVVNVILFNIAQELQNEQFIEAAKLYVDWLYHQENLKLFNVEGLDSLLARLKELNKNDLAIQIISQFLTIRLEVNKRKNIYGDKDHNEFNEILKIVNASSDYVYAKVIEKIQKHFSDDSLKLFDLYCTTYEGLFDTSLDKKLIEEYDHNFSMFKRKAIEPHSQDRMHDNSINLLISEIRDTAENIINTGTKNDTKHVFCVLQKNNRALFIRIMLHLLRTTNNYDKTLLNKYLCDTKILSNSNYHHELWLLKQSKFGDLSKASKDKIFKYIDMGPKGVYYKKDEPNYSAEKKKFAWKLQELEPIKEYLTAYQKKKYKSFLEEFNKPKDEEYEKYHNPSFLFYMGSTYTRGSTSPIEDSKMAEMTIEDIVHELNAFKPDTNKLHAPEIEGLANTLETDLKGNPKKYLQKLELFEQVIEPRYISKLLYVLLAVENKTLTDWRKVQNLCKWVTKKDDAWHWAKQGAARILSNLYTDSYKDINISDAFVKNSFNILRDLVLSMDKELEEKNDSLNTLRDHREFYNSAINSTHGTALEALIFLAFWKSNQKKTTKDIVLVFNQLLENSTYPESWAVFGRLYPWLHYNFKKWANSNLDNIFPKDNTDKFDAAWQSYLYYSKFYANIFKVLEPIYQYVLDNHLYEDDQKEEKRVGVHIAIAYANKLIGQESNLLKSALDMPVERNEMIRHIGFLTKEDKVPVAILNRFMELWEWILIQIKGREADFAEMLANFGWWYRFKSFDRKWALEQLRKVVVDFNVQIDSFSIPEVLLEDLPKHPRLVFDVARVLFLTPGRWTYSPDEDVIEDIIKYISNNDFPGDKTIKKDAIDFMNKFLESRTYDAQTWSDKLNPYFAILTSPKKVKDTICIS